MAKEVAALIERAQDDSALRQALMRNPDQVARDRDIPRLVTRAAARALSITAVGLAALGVWF
jgi:hypothetical protein